MNIKENPKGTIKYRVGDNLREGERRSLFYNIVGDALQYLITESSERARGNCESHNESFRPIPRPQPSSGGL